MHNDTEICKQVEFQCIPNRKPFSDECGCGCELIDDLGKTNDNAVNDGELETIETYCTPNQRKANFCAEVYEPVCGWNDGAKIQCIKYPCAQDYSNSCFACKEENVLYWTSGKCPK